MKNRKQIGILAVSLSTEGFGYALMESANSLVDYGNKVFTDRKNDRSLNHITKLIGLFKPSVLVLHDVNAKGSYRAARIKELHRNVLTLAEKHKLKVAQISGRQLRIVLLGDPSGTKHDVATYIAELYSDDLADRLPPKRQLWESQPSRMDIFDAVALALAFLLKPAKRRQEGDKTVTRG